MEGAMFIGREKELRDLNRLYERNSFQLYVLYGRRRIGKTTLLKEFCRDKKAIFYSAEQSSVKINLDKFSALVFEHYHEEHLEPFSSWENALLYIDGKQSEEQLILVLDEFPYLAERDKSMMSVLQHLIDHRLKDGKLFIVLCGSYMGFMEKEVLGAKSPLFGRRTAQLHMKAFDCRTSIRFFPGFEPEEQLMLYGALGGTPMYLQQVTRELSWEGNIKNIFLEPTGYLYEEPMLLLRQELQEPGIYNAVIEAIASGASRANEIAGKTGEAGSTCLKYIKTLIELGIIYKETPFGEKESSRKTLYRISDMMFRFWFRYVSGNRTLLETDAQDIVLEKRIKPDYSNYMGLVFESICRDHLLAKNSHGELPILFTEIGRWWGTDSKTHKQIEIDIVARDKNDYLICECKWRNELLDYGVLEELKAKADSFCSKRDKTYFVLFSKSGFTPALEKAAANTDDIILIGLEEIVK